MVTSPVLHQWAGAVRDAATAGLGVTARRAAAAVADVPTRFDVALAAAGTLLAAAFALSTLDRWLRRRRPHELAWTIALALFAVATGALWYGYGRGWSAASFRVFYLAGAILNVPWLALGTVYLLGGERVGDRTRIWLLWLSGLATGVVLVAPMRRSVPAVALPEGRELFGAFPRVLAAVGSGVAAVVIVGGALWTAWRFRPGRRGAADSSSRISANRVAGTLVIAAGTLVLSSAGTFSARLGASRAFTLTTAVGVAILFVGQQTATYRRKP